MRKVIINKCLINYVTTENFDNKDLLHYCKKLSNTFGSNNLDEELLPNFLTKNFSKEEQKILFCKFRVRVDASNTRVEASRARINNIIYHSKNYIKKGKTNSYTVCYNINKYGNILYFFIFDKKMYAVIEKIEILADLKNIFDGIEDKFKLYVNEQNFKKFYQLTSCLIELNEIILVNQIICKTIVISNNQNSFITNLVSTCKHS